MRRVAAAAAGVWLVVGAAALDPAAQESPILAAMHDELTRSMADLRMKGEAPPYYIAYEVLDRMLTDASGRLGAVVENPPRRSRTLRVEVRVGDYTFDSSRFVVQGLGNAGLTGEAVIAPIDDDYDAMRRELWMTTDLAYKRAITRFARKKAAFQNRTSSDPIADFSREAPVEVILPALAFRHDSEREERLARVRESSAAFSAFPALTGSDVSISQVRGMRYFINSEGFRTITPVEIATATVQAEAQAEDGMPARRTFSAVGRRLADLPLTAALEEHARELAAGVLTERAAPLGDDFAGPVLIEGIASARFIGATLVPMMQARRSPDSENPRMAQPPPPPLLNRVGLRVMADAFSVRDTPSLTTSDGAPVPGSYVVDDEGVRAKDVTLVDKGRLVTLLTSRTPQKNFAQSNGHGRAGTVLAGVFQVESAQGVPASELKPKYLALLAAQEKTFGYIVRGVRADGQGGAPVIDSAVRVALDGTETPVRGMRFANVPAMAFRDLSEASIERSMHSFRAGATSVVSVIAPSLLFEELEIQRVRDILQKPPVVPSPLK